MKNRSLTAAYSAVQGTFWMGYCIWSSFAAHYLQQLGYTNAELGWILAVGNLLGAVFGPYLSSLVDRRARLSPNRLIPLMLTLQLACVILLLFVRTRSLFATVVYVLYIAFSLTVNSLNLKLYVDFSYRGLTVEYGFARGMGSLCYVLVTMLVGTLIDRCDLIILPILGIVLCGLQAAAHFTVCRMIREHPIVRGESAAQTGSTIPVFLKKYRRFCLVLFGTMLLFACHNVTNNFLINITKNVGGSAGTMGYFHALIAASEIPVMLLFARFARRRKITFWLAVSFIAFTLKAAAVAAAPNIPVLAAALLLQAPSFALYTAAIVPYAQQAVPYEDSAKAQSLAFTMTTVGSVFASIFGGKLLDSVSVTQTLWIAVSVSVLGMFTALAGLAGNRRPHGAASKEE